MALNMPSSCASESSYIIADDITTPTPVPHYYASQRFTSTGGTGNTIIETTLPTVLNTSNTTDTYILLYSGSFNPTNPAIGVFDCNDDGGSDGRLSKLVISNLPAGNYEIVVTTFASNSSPPNTGTTTLSFSSPSAITLGGTPINAQIDLHFSKQVESYSTEIELK